MGSHKKKTVPSVFGKKKKQRKRAHPHGAVFKKKKSSDHPEKDGRFFLMQKVAKTSRISLIWYIGTYIMETQGKGERKMTYEQAEKRIEELNEEITKIYNKIVEMTWVNKDFSNPKVKALEEKAIDLQGKRWELKEMLEA